MVKKLFSLPGRVLKKVFGGKKEAAPPPPPRPAPRPRPVVEPEEGGGGHSHGHDHGGGHDHGHAHGGEPEPAPAEDRGHDHGHSHDSAPEPAAKAKGKKAAKAEPEVGAHIAVDVSETPNPNARKFTCSITVIEKGSLSFNAADEAGSHPLGKHIWAVGGVKGIFAVKDFVTVTKVAEADWNDLSPKIIPAIRRGLVERGT